MNRTKKLSGAEFKKKRKQRLESDEKLRNCFKKWLVTNSVEKQIISEDTCIEVNDNSTDPIIDLSSDQHLELIEEEIFISQNQEEFCTTDSEQQGKMKIPSFQAQLKWTRKNFIQKSQKFQWPRKKIFNTGIQQHGLK